jgi:hypothetical protein
MDMIRTGIQEYRFSFIISECGTDFIRGGGIVAITPGGGKMGITAGDPGTPLHSITLQGPERTEILLRTEILALIVPIFLM